MNEQIITCPHCNRDFELGKALTDKISQGLRVDIEATARRKEAELKARLREVEERGAKLDEEVSRKLEAKRKRLEADAQRKAQETLGLELQAAREELEEKTTKLRVAEKAELDLRKKERALIEKQETQELELVRRLDEERGKIAEEAKAKFAEQQRLKMREKDDLVQSLKSKVDDLQRRIDVGSQEGQGETLEGELVDILRLQFPFDECEEVKKGQPGADILQRVRTPAGKFCGTISWEIKNTKSFNKDWIGKLKNDQQKAGADLAVLMTMAMPPQIKDFDYYEDVWVTSFSSATSLCSVLRQMLASVDRAKVVSENKEGLKDVVYQYITGQEFSQRVKMVASTYLAMQKDLVSEKAAMSRIWGKREKQISTVLNNVTGMYGEIEGLLGGEAVLPGVDVLSLNGVAEGGDDEDDED